MASKFKGRLRREIRLYEVPTPVIVTLTEDGVDLSVPGSRTKITASWEAVARAAQTPTNVPSTLYQQPIKFLKHQAEKALKKKG